MAFLPENIFLKIIDGTLPCTKVYESDTILAFRDIHPKAREHILIIPKKEIRTALDLTPEDARLVGEMFLAAQIIAKELGLEGYKFHMNVGEKGGQVVPHLHLHMLSPDYASNL